MPRPDLDAMKKRHYPLGLPVGNCIYWDQTLRDLDALLTYIEELEVECQALRKGR